MTYLAPIGNGFQFLTSGGLPLNAGTISTYAAGTTTPLPTYTTSSGSVANANPIVLNTDGRPPNEIWLSPGLGYKFVLADSLGNLIATYDNLSGINDPTGLSEWIAGSTPTYVSPTTFTVPGNQLATYTPGRRILATITGQIVYGTVNSATYSTATLVTTVVCVMDTPLNSGLSTVSYGILNATNPSSPRIPLRVNQITANVRCALAQTGDVWLGEGAYTAQLPSATKTGWTGRFYAAGGALTITTAMAPPAAPTLSSVSGGTIAATTYYVKATLTSQEGQQTLASGESSLAVAADSLLLVESPTTTLPNATWSVAVSTSTGTETIQQSGIPIGTNWTLRTTGLITGPALPTTQGGNIIFEDGSSATSYTLATNGSMLVQADGANYRTPLPRYSSLTVDTLDVTNSATVPNATASNNPVALGQWTYGGTAAAGWRKDPVGNIEQWGQFAPISVAATTQVTESITFPIDFTVLDSILVQVGLANPTTGSIYAMLDTSVAISLSGFTAGLSNSYSAAQDVGFTWTARGR